MKIAIVYDVAYPYRFGGGEKRSWEVAKGLAARGHDVTLVSLRMWDGDRIEVRDGVRCVGVCDWREGLFRDGKRSFGEPFYFARHVYRFLKSEQWDIIDCGNFPYLPCLSAWIASWGRRARLVITWYEVRGLKRWLAHKGWMGVAAWCAELVISRITRLNVAISPFTAERAGPILGMPVAAVIPCGVQSRTREKANDAPVRNSILYVGRLVDYKRVDVLIETFAGLAAEFADLSLTIVGTGVALPGLREQAERLSVSERVEFVESLPEEELLARYSRAKVFVLPSEQEGFGIVIIEAMARGTPVVALDAPDSAAGDLVRNGENGFLFRDGQELADAVREILSDAELRAKLSECSMATAGEYDWEQAIVPAVDMFYRKHLSTKESENR